jgi:uncharacterized pyridoxamine 5'-phosphate oxidase family protein
VKKNVPESPDFEDLKKKFLKLPYLDNKFTIDHQRILNFFYFPLCVAKFGSFFFWTIANCGFIKKLKKKTRGEMW